MINAEETDIFISYRRVDGRDYARNIQLALAKEGFPNVFFDYNSMRAGMFNEQILTAISHCKDFILVLSPQSMLRCANEGDWVAKEIQTAIESGCKIIPVQINEPFTNWPEDLPRRFNFIKQIEFLTLRTDEYFDASITRLVSWLDTKPARAISSTSTEHFALEVNVDETCELQIDGQKIRKLKGGKSYIIENLFKPGKRYNLTFVSLASKTEPYNIEYTCSETILFGSIDISFAEMREQKKLAEKLEKERKEAELQIQREHEMLLKAACDQYDESGWERDGMTPIMKNHKIGFLNSNCFEAIPCIYDNTSEFCNGYATVCLGNKWGIIDESGQIVIPFKSDIPCYERGYYKYFICAVEKHFAISTIERGFPDTFPYEDIIAIDKYPDLFFVKQGGLWKMINASGGAVPFKATAQEINISSYISDWYKYNHLWFREGWQLQICPLPVGISHPQTGKYAYLNSNLEMTIPFIDELSGYNTYEENIIIKTNSKMSLVNPELGKTIIPPIYDDIKKIFYEQSWDLYLVSNDAQWDNFDVTPDGKRKLTIGAKLIGGRQGVLDGQGNIIIPQIYQKIEMMRTCENTYILAHQLKDMKTYVTEVRNTSVLRYEFNRESSIVDFYTTDGERVKSLPYKDY